MGKYKELTDKLWGCRFANDEELAALLENAAEAIEHLCIINAAAEAKQKLLLLAKLTAEVERLHSDLSKEYFEDIDWDAGEIYCGCTIDDDGLKDAAGNLLSRDGRCMDEPMGYFVNQMCGWLGDDYYGTMFVSVDEKGTFVAVPYSC